MRREQDFPTNTCRKAGNGSAVQEENMEQLKVEGISKSFDGERVLEDISIALNKGELVSLLGISGGGKTTLFNIIAGLSSGYRACPSGRGGRDRVSGTGELYAAEGPAPALPDHRG